MKRYLILFSAILAVLIIVSSCRRENPWAKQERIDINDYILGLGDTLYYTMTSGLYIIPLVQGTGEDAATGDTVLFKYKGMFLDGEVFDNYDIDTLPPMKTVIGSAKVIPGVEEGLRHIKTGGRARLLTPSSLAFGPTGIGSLIPGYSPLLWDVRMIEIRRKNSGK